MAWFKNEQNIHLLKKLQKEIKIENPKTSNTSLLSGKSIVFTGTLPTLGRDEAKEMAREVGAVIASSVSKKTDYVVLGDNAGGKANRAEEFGVKTLTEAEFLELVDRQG